MNYYNITNYLPIITILLCTLALFSLLACNIQQEQKHGKVISKEKNTPLANLKKEIMQAHDSAMIHIDSILIKKIALKKKLGKRRKSNNSDTMRLIQNIQTLNVANKSMFEWMGKYEPNAKLENDSLTQNYFENQLLKVKKVRDNINKTLSIKP